MVVNRPQVFISDLSAEIFLKFPADIRVQFIKAAAA
jgi:hypothetical protein